MSTPAPRVGIPLRPDPTARAREQRKSLLHAITAVAFSSQDHRADQYVARAFPTDHQAALIITASERERLGKAAVSVGTLASSGYPAVVQLDVLPLLGPMSAAVRLFARCMKISLDGINTVSVARGVPGTTPIFIAEGAPMPVVKLNFTPSVIGPAKKILIGTAISNELENHGVEVVSDVIGHLLAEKVTLALDAPAFDNAAANAARPAGLLNGLSAQPASTATGLAAIAADLGNLAAVIAAAGIGSDDMVVVTNPKQAAMIRILAPGFDNAVFGTAGVPDKRVIAIAPGAVASAYSGVPTIEKVPNALFHFEDTSPADIGTAGTPAAPAREAFQSDLTAIRVRCKAAWGTVAPGIAFVDNVAW